MAVNSGTLGTTISFSDLQSAYGGSHPISASEYYRGGSEVPSTQTITNLAANSASGTASNTTGGIAVTVTTVSGFGSLSIPNQAVATGNSLPYSIPANTSFIGIGYQHEDKDGGSSFASYILRIGTTNVTFNSSDNTGNGAFLRDGYVRSDNYVSGDQNQWFSFASGALINAGFLAAGGQISHVSGGDRQRIRLYRGSRSSVTTYNHSITNNSGHAVNMTMSPWGNDSSFTNGETATDNGNSSASWSWSHPAVTSTQNANTNIPTSGTTNLDQYNVPGTFAG